MYLPLSARALELFIDLNYMLFHGLYLIFASFDVFLGIGLVE
jgi:hypothetical protein